MHRHSENTTLHGQRYVYPRKPAVMRTPEDIMQEYAKCHWEAWMEYQEIYNPGEKNHAKTYKEHTNRNKCPQILFLEEKARSADGPLGSQRMQDELVEPISAKPNGNNSKKCNSKVTDDDVNGSLNRGDP